MSKIPYILISAGIFFLTVGILLLMAHWSPDLFKKTMTIYIGFIFALLGVAGFGWGVDLAVKYDRNIVVRQKSVEEPSSESGSREKYLHWKEEQDKSDHPPISP
jgi:hypothetical protein